MPKKEKAEKPVTEMTTEELAQKVFPKPVLEHLKKVAKDADSKSVRSSQKKSTT